MKDEPSDQRSVNVLKGQSECLPSVSLISAKSHPLCSKGLLGSPRVSASQANGRTWLALHARSVFDPDRSQVHFAAYSGQEPFIYRKRLFVIKRTTTRFSVLN